MKKILFPIVALVLMLLPATATAKGPKDKVVTVPVREAYHKLVVDAPFAIRFSDSAKAITLDLPETYRKRLTVDFDHGTLRIALRSLKDLRRLSSPVATVVLPANTTLDNIELSAAASLDAGNMERESLSLYLTEGATLKGRFVAKRVDMELAGGSDLMAHMAVDNVSLTLRSASTVELRGRALIKMELKMTEGASIDAEKFEAKRIEGSMADASHAILWCTERLHVPLSGNSHIVYIGRPIVVNCPAADLSTVIHK